MPTLALLFVLVIGVIVATFAAIFILVPLIKGFGWLLRQIFRFIGGEVSDVLRIVGAIITIPFLSLFTIGSVIIGRWSSSSRRSRSVCPSTSSIAMKWHGTPSTAAESISNVRTTCGWRMRIPSSASRWKRLNVTSSETCSAWKTLIATTEPAGPAGPSTTLRAR
jgi:hypothetical protein